MSQPNSPNSKVVKKICLETLPPETLQLILLNLPDLPSLLCTALSSRTIHRVFRHNESLLVSTILQRQIPPPLLTSALASQAAARIQVVCVETTREFFNTYLQRSPSSPPPPIPGRLRDAIPISRLHFYIRSFSRGFASRTVAKQPKHRGNDERDASLKEMERIERAFYRFEIYNNLFKRKQANPRHMPEDQIDTFFCAFSAWENEQLAIVHEFLAGLVIPVFNELAEHDILWGYHTIEPVPDSSSEFIQAIIARGLPALHRLTRAKTYSQKYKVLYSQYPTYYTKFLYRGLEAYHVNAAFTGEKAEKEFYSDGDTGPREAWEWAHRGISPVTSTEFEDTKMWKELRDVRSWAYVFWDRSRLTEWGALSTPFTPTSEPASTWESTRKTQEYEASVKRRTDIHVAGGSGYWSSEDESKIVWKPGRPSPHDSATRRKECQLCFGSVQCAPHRLVLKLPASKPITNVVDDGCFLELDMSALDSIGRVPPKLDLDPFRISHMPTPLQTSRASLFSASESRSTYLTPTSASSCIRPNSPPNQLYRLSSVARDSGRMGSVKINRLPGHEESRLSTIC